MQRRMKTNFLLAIVISLCCVSCHKNDVYFQYNAVNPAGWSKDSAYTFEVPIMDTLASYNIYVNIRNRGEYPYQNMWLFLHKLTPDSIQSTDSIECYLADNRGKWLGSGIGSVYEMPVLYQQNVRFKTAGTYKYKIVQGMRDDVLAGINDIGIRVEKIAK